MNTETFGVAPFIGDGGSANIDPKEGDYYPDGWIERDFGF